MINRRVSSFYRYPLKAFHHMVCPCTLDGVCVVCPGTSELVGQHFVLLEKQAQSTAPDIETFKRHKVLGLECNQCICIKMLLQSVLVFKSWICSLTSSENNDHKRKNQLANHPSNTWLFKAFIVPRSCMGNCTANQVQERDAQNIADSG